MIQGSGNAHVKQSKAPKLADIIKGLFTKHSAKPMTDHVPAGISARAHLGGRPPKRRWLGQAAPRIRDGR